VRHFLKIWPEFFEPVMSGVKRFEVRKNDRNFQVDDVLDLSEWNPRNKEFTGRTVTVRVTYILAAEFSRDILEDVVIMSISLVAPSSPRAS